MSDHAEVNLEPDPNIESPPPTEMPAKEPAPDPRVELLRLATQLRQRHDRRQLIEYLRLRRAAR